MLIRNSLLECEHTIYTAIVLMKHTHLDKLLILPPVTDATGVLESFHFFQAICILQHNVVP